VTSRSVPVMQQAFTSGPVRMFNAIAFLILTAWILHDATSKTVFGETPWPQSVVDFRILYEVSHDVARTHEYRTFFPYSPAAVTLFSLLALPFPAAAGLWMAITVVAALGIFVLSTALVGLAGSLWRWPIALGAYGLLNYYFQWDLRSQNCNTVYAVLLVGALWALHQGRDRLSGALLAASVALKPYPILVLPYLIWRGERRAALATGWGMLLLFVVLPFIWMGPAGCIQAYHGYLDQLFAVVEMSQRIDHPTLISIPHDLRKRLGVDHPTVPWLVWVATVAWVVSVTTTTCLGARRKFSPTLLAHGDLASVGRLRIAWLQCFDFNFNRPPGRLRENPDSLLEMKRGAHGAYLGRT